MEQVTQGRVRSASLEGFVRGDVALGDIIKWWENVGSVILESFARTGDPVTLHQPLAPLLPVQFDGENMYMGMNDNAQEFLSANQAFATVQVLDGVSKPVKITETPLQLLNELRISGGLASVELGSHSLCPQVLSIGVGPSQVPGCEQQIEALAVLDGQLPSL
ncbi:hypothetical protein TURU_033542 [Turdus rufiventris]|nr:hypothetical protein TURU_033542 [Turdus rufiventris]